jgi:Flp pilus assembly pilin Flp
MSTIATFLSDEAGQDGVEYALLVGFVVFASVAGISTVMNALSGLWTSLNNLLSAT